MSVSVRVLAHDACHLEALRRATGVIAHGLTNRLTAIAGFLELARQSVETGRSPLDDLEAASDVVSRSAEQIAGLLAFARRDGLVASEREVGRLVRSFAEAFAAEAPPSIRLRLDLDPQTGTAAVDPAAFHHVLTALAANAREAMPEGGVLTVRAASRVLDARACSDRYPLLRPGRWAEITLGDTGPGMDESVRERCFDPFYSTKASPSHVGLGLASCYAIMRQMNGLIEIESAPDQGTLARLLLPRVDG